MASYVDRERRMLNLVIALVCCYVTCWLPYHATRIFMFFAPPSWYACNQTVFGKIKKVVFLMPTAVGDRTVSSNYYNDPIVFEITSLMMYLL